MPPRSQPKVFILLLKTHKLTVLLTAPSSSTISELKAEALNALQSNVLTTPNALAEHAMDEDDNEWEVPTVSSVHDIELAKAVKEKGRPTGRYETLDGKAQLKNVAANWEPIFIQFKDGDGQLLPVKVSIPSILAEEDEEEDPSLSTARKGKRKAVE